MHASILKYFTEVARSGSIRKASEELHVATSAVSRQIKKLEDELGTPLFERFSDGLRLTSAGEIVLRHAKETLQDFEVMKSISVTFRERIRAASISPPSTACSSRFFLISLRGFINCILRSTFASEREPTTIFSISWRRATLISASALTLRPHMT